MAPINGKYQYVKSENYVEMLVKGGMPEEDAKKRDKLYVTGIQVDGKKVTVTLSDNSTAVYEEGSELVKGDVKITLKLDGTTVKSHKVYPSGKVWDTDFVFTEEGYEELNKGADGVVRAKRYFKRV